MPRKNASLRRSHATPPLPDFGPPSAQISGQRLSLVQWRRRAYTVRVTVSISTDTETENTK